MNKNPREHFVHHIAVTMLGVVALCSTAAYAAGPTAKPLTTNDWFDVGFTSLAAGTTITAGSTTGFARGAGSWTSVPSDGGAEVVADGSATCLSIDADTDDLLVLEPVALSSAVNDESISVEVNSTAITSLPAVEDLPADPVTMFSLLDNGSTVTPVAYVAGVWTNLVYAPGAQNLTNAWFTLCLDFANDNGAKFVRFTVEQGGTRTVLQDSADETWFPSSSSTKTSISGFAISGSALCRTISGDYMLPKTDPQIVVSGSSVTVNNDNALTFDNYTLSPMSNYPSDTFTIPSGAGLAADTKIKIGSVSLGKSTSQTYMPDKLSLTVGGVTYTSSSKSITTGGFTGAGSDKYTYSFADTDCIMTVGTGSTIRFLDSNGDIITGSISFRLAKGMTASFLSTIRWTSNGTITAVLMEATGDIVKARVGDTLYPSISAAVDAAQDGATVTLVDGSSETVALNNKTITFAESGFAFDGKFTGNGNIVLTSAPATTTWSADRFDAGWTGTVTLDWPNIVSANDLPTEFNKYGISGSTVEVGANGSASGYLNSTPVPKLKVTGTLEFKNGSVYETNQRIINYVTGSGCLKVTHHYNNGGETTNYKITTLENWNGVITNTSEKLDIGTITGGSGNIYLAANLWHALPTITSWTGTVTLDWAGIVKAGDISAKVNGYGISGSTVEIGPNGTITGNSYFNSNPNPALKISGFVSVNNGSTANERTISSVSGNGVLVFGDGGAMVNYKISTLEDWNGVITNSSTQTYVANYKSGSGRVVIVASPENATVSVGEDWRGTVVVDWAGNGAIRIGGYGNANSTVVINKSGSGFLTTGASDANPTFDGTLEIREGVRFDVNNGWSGGDYRIGTLKGAGTIKFGNTQHRWTGNRDIDITSVNADEFTGTLLVGNEFRINIGSILCAEEPAFGNPYIKAGLDNLTLSQSSNGYFNLGSTVVNIDGIATCNKVLLATVNDVSGLYKAVAQVGANYYATLSDAVAANNGGTVTLLDNSSENITLTAADQTFTLVKGAFAYNGTVSTSLANYHVKAEGTDTVVYSVTVSPETLVEIASVVTPEWKTANGLSADATDEQIQAKMRELDANGNAKWQNLVLGQDGSESTAVVASTNGTATTAVIGLTFTPPANSGYTVKYALDKVDRTGAVVEGATEQATPEIDLTQVAAGTPAYFKIRAVLTNEYVGSSVAVEKIIGVTRVDSTSEYSIVGVPWASFGDSDIKVSELIYVGNRNEGDVLMAYDPVNKDYKTGTWTLNADKVWEPTQVTKETESGSESGTATAANLNAIKRGSGVWLKRVNTAAPIYLLGQVSNATATVELAARESETEPSWNLVASSLPTTLNLNGGLTITPSAGDQIRVPTAGAPIEYTYKDGAWGRMKATKNASGIIEKTWTTEGATVPAGCGFWYLNTSEGTKDLSL